MWEENYSRVKMEDVRERGCQNLVFFVVEFRRKEGHKFSEST